MRSTARHDEAMPLKRQSIVLLTIRQVAEMLQVSRRTLSKYINDGSIPSLRIGPRVFRFRASEIEAWLADQQQRASTDPSTTSGEAPSRSHAAPIPSAIPKVTPQYATPDVDVHSSEAGDNEVQESESARSEQPRATRTEPAPRKHDEQDDDDAGDDNEDDLM